MDTIICDICGKEISQEDGRKGNFRKSAIPGSYAHRSCEEERRKARLAEMAQFVARPRTATPAANPSSWIVRRSP